MRQYVQKVHELDIGFDPNATPSKARAGFAKGPSRMAEEEDDDEFVDENWAKLIYFIRDDDVDGVEDLLKEQRNLIHNQYEGVKSQKTKFFCFDSYLSSNKKYFATVISAFPNSSCCRLWSIGDYSDLFG